MGYTPSDEDLTTYLSKLSLYCKYCGNSHPVDQFQILQDNCKRKIRPRADLIKLELNPGETMQPKVLKEEEEELMSANIYHNENIESMEWIRKLVSTTVSKVTSSSTIEDEGEISRKTVEAMLFKAACLFSKSLVKHTISVYGKEDVSSNPATNRIIAPGHVWTAITTENSFDFLIV